MSLLVPLDCCERSGGNSGLFFGDVWMRLGMHERGEQLDRILKWLGGGRTVVASLSPLMKNFSWIINLPEILGCVTVCGCTRFGMIARRPITETPAACSSRPPS
jgi:hypothetical protein